MPIENSKFSNFVDGGDLEIDDVVVGLRSGVNTRFSFQGVPDTYLPLAGGTMEGAIDMDGNGIINVPLPTNDGDAANKLYVDTAVGGVDPLTTKGDLFTFTTINARLAVGVTDGMMLQVLASEATGLAWSTATYPRIATSTGSILYANGTNWVASTSLWPNTVGTVGKIIRSDGTTNAYTTSTFADTYAINTILYNASANTVTGLATANNGLLVTSNTGVPSILAGTGATGNILQSNAAAAPSFSTATFPSVATSTGSFLYANGTNWVASTSLWVNTVGSAGVIVRSNGTNNVYSTSTFADTYAINSIPYASAANTITALAPSLSSVLISSAASTGVPAWSGALANGQLIIGSTGATPVVGTLTAGAGISIANGAGSITISGTGSGIGWNEIVASPQAMTSDTGYVANTAGLLTFTLPVLAAFGTAIDLIGKGAGGWLIAQNAGQNIQVGSVSSTVGAGGSVASTNRFDSISLICTTANTTWTVLGAPQSAGLTIV